MGLTKDPKMMNFAYGLDESPEIHHVEKALDSVV